MLLKAQSISAQRPKTRVCVTEKTNEETSEAKTAYSREEMQELGFGGACIAKEQSLDCTKDECWEMSESPACLRCSAHKQPWLSEPQTTAAFTTPVNEVRTASLTYFPSCSTKLS